MVAHTGLEPVISALRGQRVNQLHQCAAPGIIGAGWRVRKLEEFPGVWQRAIETFKLFTGIAGVSPAKLLQKTSRRFQSGSYHNDFAGEMRSQ